MGALNEKLRAKMQQHYHAAKQAMQGSGSRFPKWDLTGKNAVVEPGSYVLLRLLPRWDYAQKWDQQGDQWVLNPNYEEDLIYFVALEHWWDGRDNKPNQEYCPKTLDEAAACPICEGAEQLLRSADKKDREAGKRALAKKVYMYNAVCGKIGKRLLTDKNVPDVRVLCASNTIFAEISAFMTGGGDGDDDRAAFARGDVSDPEDGYDLMLTRPKKDSGERWSVDCAPQPCALYGPTEEGAFADWVSLLIDIPAEVEKSIKGYDDLHQVYYGAPRPSETSGPATPPRGAAPAASAGAPGDVWGAHVPQAGASAPPAGGQAPFDPPSRPAPAAPRRPSGRR